MFKKKNILMISARADYGGGPEHVYRLISSLDKRFTVYVACPEDYPYWERFSQLLGLEHLIKIPHRKFTLSALILLARTIFKYKIDIIHSHGKGAGIYSRILAILTFKPCVHTFHGLHIGQLNLINKYIYINIERIFSVFTRKFISVSMSEFKTISNWKITPSRKVTIIPNAVIIPETPATVDNVHQKTKVITTISRNDYAKNPQLLISIAQQLKSKGMSGKFKITIIGPGFKEDDLWNEGLKNAGVEDIINIIGPVDNPGEYLLKSFCYISTSRWEGMPLGIMEAMAHGLPVIATDVTGNKDLVESGKTGYLYDISDPSSAVMVILELAQNPEQWEKLSKEARINAVNNFSLSIMAENTKAVYLNL